MSAYRAVQDIVDVLRLIPEAVVPHSRIGSISPTKKAELPAVVATLSEAAEVPIGIGRLEGLGRISDDEWSEATGTRTTGRIAIEILAENAATVETITGRVTDLLIDPAHSLARGFLKLSLSAVGAVGETGIGRNQNVAAFSRVLEYHAVHEHITRADPGPGGIIDEIQVDMHDEFHESFDVP